MNAGCRTKASDRSNAVMTGGGTAIGGRQKQQPVKAQGLKGRLDQGPWSAKRIEVDEIEPLTVQDRSLEQSIGGISTDPLWASQLLQIGRDQRQSVWITIVNPQLCRSGRGAQRLQPPAKTTDPATGHQIKPTQRSG